jgi:hypothetical protein
MTGVLCCDTIVLGDGLRLFAERKLIIDWTELHESIHLSVGLPRHPAAQDTYRKPERPADVASWIHFSRANENVVGFTDNSPERFHKPELKRNYIHKI